MRRYTPAQGMTMTAPTACSAPAVTAERFTEGFRWMLLARTVEDKIAALYHAGKIVGGVYLGRGQEAFSAALAMNLDRARGDIFAPLIRDQAGRLVFGETLLDGLRTYLGSALGPMRGRDGNIHRGAPKTGMPAMISHLGSMISVVSGMLMARRFRGQTGMVGAAAIGEGGTSTGAWHEALNLAAVEKLPLVIAVANNQFAYSTPASRQFACENLADRARGYGIRGYNVNGTDLAACLVVFEEAVARARDGHGPQMVVGKLLRLCGHGEHDDATYVPPDLRGRPENCDCLKAARATMLENDWTTVRELEAMEHEAYEMVQDAVARAQRDPVPDASRETWAALSSSWLIEGGAA
jgi:TPP-dependent pyruvate/acetoin dehydrogenase alpha subunit